MSDNVQTSPIVKKPQLSKQISKFRDALKADEIRLTADEAKLHEAQVQMEAFGKSSERVEAELEKMRIRLEELQKQHETLKSRVEPTEQKASRQPGQNGNDSLEVKQQQFENRIRDLERQMQDLQEKKIKQNAEPTTDNNEMPQERYGTQTFSFHIDLWPSEGDYSGQIEKMVTGEKIRLTNKYKEELIQFIASHLQHLEKKAERIDAKVASISGVPSWPETKNGMEVRLFLTDLYAIQPGVEAPRGFVTCGKVPFQVQMKAAPSNVRPVDLPLVYELSVYAEDLQSKTRDLIGNVTDTISSACVFPIRLQVKALTTGVYRLQAALTAKQKEGKHALSTSLIEGGLVQIK